MMVKIISFENICEIIIINGEMSAFIEKIKNYVLTIIDLTENQKDQLYELMNNVHEILCENDIKYFAIGGTLLGAIRENKIIRWDSDLDIRIFENDINKFSELKHIFKKRGIILRRSVTAYVVA